MLSNCLNSSHSYSCAQWSRRKERLQLSNSACYPVQHPAETNCQRAGTPRISTQLPGWCCPGKEAAFSTGEEVQRYRAADKEGETIDG